MGRATSGVTGMKFRTDDELLSMTVIHRDADAAEGDDELFVFTVTDGGFAKKTSIEQYRLQGRGGLGIKAMEITEKRGKLVGGLVLKDSDDVISITQGGQVTRSLVSGVPAKGRGTMGVSFVKFKGDDRVVTIARNAELPGADDVATDEAGAGDNPTDEAGAPETAAEESPA
jgi:DNA gyrase subunit A